MMDLLRSVSCAGTAAVITVTIVHPIDTVKTRLQVSGTKGARNYREMGAIKTVTTISTDEGVLAFWKGIPAAWLREASYTAIRLGLYKPIVDSTGATGFLGKCSAGCVAGGIGSVVGNPFDVLKTKMMASEGTAEPIIKVAERIKDSQGMGGFYRGIDANIVRAMVNNGTKLAVYDSSKQWVASTGNIPKESSLTIISSAIIAGFFTAATAAPFDLVRTRLMNQPMDGPRMYNSLSDCFVKVIRAQGVFSLWSGFIPMWSRIAPGSVLQLFLYEKIMALTGGKAI